LEQQGKGKAKQSRKASRNKGHKMKSNHYYETSIAVADMVRKKNNDYGDAYGKITGILYIIYSLY
jgi:hypothetical protein